MDEIVALQELLEKMATQNMWIALSQFALIVIAVLAFAFLRKNLERKAEEKFDQAIEKFKSELIREQWVRDNRLGDFKEIRKETGNAGRQLLAFLHTMAWYCWKAKNTSEEVNINLKTEYDNAMKPLMPEMLGSVSVIASLDREAYKVLKKIEQELLEYDHNIALSFQKVDSDHSTAISELKGYYDRLDKLEKTGGIATKIWDALNAVRQKYYEDQ